MNKLYGYCRISTAQQSIDRQVRNIKSAYPDAVIIREVFTGTTTWRKEWNKLLNVVEQGDTIVFDSVSRMSRNSIDGTVAYFDLYNKGIELVFLKEPHINTTTYKKALQGNVAMTGTKTDIILKAVNEYLKELAKEQIRLSFEQAEKEVSDLHQRTKEGMLTAKLNGKQIGQRKGASLNIKKKEPVQKIIQSKSKDFSGTNTDDEVIAIINNTLHISRNTYYKYKKELKEQHNID